MRLTAEEPPYKGGGVATSLPVTDELIASIQKGYIIPSVRYGDQSKVASFNAFNTGLQAAKTVSGYINALRQTQLATRTTTFAETRVYTTAEWTELQKVSASIGAYHNVPSDIVEDMLIALTVIDDVDKMTQIANAAQISDLANAEILLNPLLILAVSQLDRIAYLSTAFNALIKAFNAFNAGAQLANNLATSFDDIFSAISTTLGGFGNNSALAKQLLNTGSADAAPGTFMTEQVLGTRVPISVITKNPQLHPPSYIGKAFFGEFANSRAVVDINQTFAKRVAVFDQYQGGAGTPMFNFQNMGRFATTNPLTTVINNILYNVNTVVAGTKEALISANAAASVADLLNVSTSTPVEMRRADNNIPVMLAIASVLAETTKSPFPSTTFKQGWYISSSIGNDLQVSNPTFIDGFRAFV